MTSFPSMQAYIDTTNATANANIQTFSALADAVFTATEQLLVLNSDAVRSLYAQTAAAVTPTTTGDGLREQFTNRFNAQTHTIATDYLRNVNDICMKTQGEIAEINAKRVSELTESMVSLLDSYAMKMPAGGTDFVSAMKSALTNAGTAYENLIKVSREVTETNLTVATKALQPMVAASASTAGKSSRKAA